MTFHSVLIAVLSLLLVCLAHGAPNEECAFAFERGKVIFPVDQLSAESRCLLAEVVDHPNTSRSPRTASDTDRHRPVRISARPSDRDSHADAAVGHGVLSNHGERIKSLLGERRGWSGRAAVSLL